MNKAMVHICPNLHCSSEVREVFSFLIFSSIPSNPLHNPALSLSSSFHYCHLLHLIVQSQRNSKEFLYLNHFKKKNFFLETEPHLELWDIWITNKKGFFDSQNLFGIKQTLFSHLPCHNWRKRWYKMTEGGLPKF